MEGARRVLFVCHGNICRSPFAEVWIRTHRPEIEVRSTGFLEKEGRSTPEHARKAARKLGFDLDGHRSSATDASAVAWADAVAVFDEWLFSELTRRFPEAKSKAVRFGVLSSTRRGEFRDPYAAGVEGCAAVYRDIAAALESLRFENQAESQDPG